MAVGNGEPGIEVSMAIPTTAAQAAQQSSAISNAVTTGALSTQWGKLGKAGAFSGRLPHKTVHLLSKLSAHNLQVWRAIWKD